MSSTRHIYIVYDNLMGLDYNSIAGIYCDRQTAEEAINGDPFYSIVKKPVRYSAKKLKRET